MTTNPTIAAQSGLRLTARIQAGLARSAAIQATAAPEPDDNETDEEPVLWPFPSLLDYDNWMDDRAARGLADPDWDRDL